MPRTRQAHRAREDMRMPLYKFMTAAHAKDAIRQHRIKISTISDLNDPYEMVPCIVDANGALMYSTETVRATLQGHLTPRHGLICLSKSIDEPLLWSHYADKHKGIALVFNFPADEWIVKIKYKQDRVSIDLSGEGELSPKLYGAYEQLIKQKYTGWKHEQEYRFIVEINPHTLKDGFYWKELPPEYFSGVVLGCLCEDAECDIQKLLHESGFKNAKVARAQMNPRQYKMNLPE